MAIVVHKLNEAGVRKLLNSNAVRNEMIRRAQRMQEAAGGSPDFKVMTGTSDRAIAVVITGTHKGRELEAEDRALTRAIDAGRD